MVPLLVVLVSGLAHPKGDAECIWTPSGLRCVLEPPWWEVTGVPQPSGTTVGFWPTLPYYVLTQLAPRSLPPPYLTPIYFPPVARPGSVYITSRGLYILYIDKVVVFWLPTEIIYCFDQMSQKLKHQLFCFKSNYLYIGQHISTNNSSIFITLFSVYHQQ